LERSRVYLFYIVKTNQKTPSLAFYLNFFIFAGVKRFTLNTFAVPARSGLTETIKQMQYLENLAYRDAEFVSWVYKKFSSDCAPCVPGKIWKYVQENFVYKDDEPFDEFLTAPYAMKETKTGDCVDYSLFIKSCLDILGGWFTHYIIFARERNQFTHVAVFAHRGAVGNNYIDPVVIDGTNPNFNIVPVHYKFYQIL